MTVKESKMQELNYVKIKRFSLLNQTYMYFDSKKHHADHIFIQHKLRVRFVTDLEDETGVYHAVICKVPKRCRKEFVACMEELKRNMLILGYTDYQDFCEKNISMLKELDAG